MIESIMNYIYELVEVIYILSYNIFPYVLYIIPLVLIGLFFEKIFSYSAIVNYILVYYFYIYLSSFVFLIVFDLWSFWASLIISIWFLFIPKHVVTSILTVIALILAINNGIWDIIYSILMLSLFLIVLNYIPLAIILVKEKITNQIS